MFSNMVHFNLVFNQDCHSHLVFNPESHSQAIFNPDCDFQAIFKSDYHSHHVLNKECYFKLFSTQIVILTLFSTRIIIFTLFSTLNIIVKSPIYKNKKGHPWVPLHWKRFSRDFLGKVPGNSLATLFPTGLSNIRHFSNLYCPVTLTMLWLQGKTSDVCQ